MEIKFTYLQFTLYLCVVRSLSTIRGVFEGKNRGGKFREISFNGLVRKGWGGGGNLLLQPGADLGFGERGFGQTSTYII